MLERKQGVSESIPSTDRHFFLPQSETTLGSGAAESKTEGRIGRNSTLCRVWFALWLSLTSLHMLATLEEIVAGFVIM